MKTAKTKALNMRIETDLYQAYVDKALKRGVKEKRLVTVSEVIREVLERNR